MKCGNMWESCLFCLGGVEIVFERGEFFFFFFDVSNLGGELEFILFYLYFPHMCLFVC